jgi:hypothetical protein
MILEMRELQPPENMGVASVDGGTLYDCRISGPPHFGPFNTLRDFHRRLRMGVESDSRLDPDVQDLIKQQDNTWPLKFTHGDLNSSNILFATIALLASLLGNSWLVSILLGIYNCLPSEPPEFLLG